MSLDESIVEEAALEWFGGRVPRLREVGNGPQLAPGEPAAEKDSFGEVVQSRVARTLIPAFSQREKEEDRKAIRRLNPVNACGNPHPAYPMGRGEEVWPTIRQFRRVQFRRRPKP
jgi:hypothetical protein